MVVLGVFGRCVSPTGFRRASCRVVQVWYPPAVSEFLVFAPGRQAGAVL